MSNVKVWEMFNGNIYLTGFIASGKSTVGRIISQRLGREFIDTTRMIARKEGKPIIQIYEEVGEKGFRKLETEVLRELARKHYKVIAVGDGAVLSPQNRETIFSSGVVIWLYSSPETIYFRVKNGRERPILKLINPDAHLYEFIQKTVKERMKYYRYSNMSVTSDNRKTAEQLTDEILRKVERYLSLKYRIV